MIKKIVVVLILFLLFFILFKNDVYTDNMIKFGVSLPKNGIMKEWGESVLSGANSYFNYTNDNELLKEKRIDLISYDDKYEPELTLKNTQKLIKEDNVFSLFNFVGTPTIKKILPLLEEEEIPFIAPFSGANFLREIDLNNIVNLRSSYEEELKNLITYLNEKKGITRFGVFYQNDDYGEEAYASLLNILKNKKITLIAEGSYKRNTLSISHSIHAMKDKDIEAIIMIGAYKANSLFIKKAREIKSLQNTIFANLSFGDANAMLKELDYKSNNLIFSEVVPNYNDTSSMIANEYRNIYKKYYPNKEYSFISYEAFISAKAVVMALKKIQGKITKEKFLKSLKTLSKKDFIDLDISFKNNQLLNKTYIFEYKDSKFIEVNNDTK